MLVGRALLAIHRDLLLLSSYHVKLLGEQLEHLSEYLKLLVEYRGLLSASCLTLSVSHWIVESNGQISGVISILLNGGREGQ